MSNEYEDYMALKRLKSSPDFQVLQALWAKQGAKIIDAVKSAASRGSETAWRYRAGEMSGFETAVTLIERALIQAELEVDNRNADIDVDARLNDIKEKNK
jgi:hypothetical protein